jgi:hypothetical protein
MRSRQQGPRLVLLVEIDGLINECVAQPRVVTDQASYFLSFIA